MTNSEAIEWLKYNKEAIERVAETGRFSDDEAVKQTIESINMAISALEKQEGKKPITVETNIYDTELCRTAKASDDVEPRPRDAEPFLTPGRTVTPAQLIAEVEVSPEEMAARRGHGGEVAIHGRLCKELMMNLYRQHLIAFSFREDKVFHVWRCRAQLQVLPPEGRVDDG